MLDDEQKPSSSQESDGVVSIFHSESKYRKRKLEVDGQIFFVNENYLGEISPFFDALFTAEFSDKQKEIISLKDESADDFDLFLHVIGSERKSVGFDQVPTMMRMADKYDVKFLAKEWSNVIKNDQKEGMLFRRFDLDSKLSLLQQVLAYESFDANVLPYLIGIIGTMHDKEELRMANAHHIVPSCVAVAIFDIAGSKRHQKEFWHDNSTKYCEKPDCRKEGADFCDCCEVYVCSDHVDEECLQAWKRVNTSLIADKFPAVESMDYRTESRRTVLFGRLRKRKWKDADSDMLEEGGVPETRRPRRNRFARFDDHSYGAEENSLQRFRRRAVASRRMADPFPPIDPAGEEHEF